MLIRIYLINKQKIILILISSDPLGDVDTVQKFTNILVLDSGRLLDKRS